MLNELKLRSWSYLVVRFYYYISLSGDFEFSGTIEKVLKKRKKAAKKAKKIAEAAAEEEVEQAPEEEEPPKKKKKKEKKNKEVAMEA